MHFNNQDNKRNILDSSVMMAPLFYNGQDDWGSVALNADKMMGGV